MPQEAPDAVVGGPRFHGACLTRASMMELINAIGYARRTGQASPRNGE